MARTSRSNRFTEPLCGNLDGNVATNLRIVRSPHFAHTAFAEQGHDFVRAEFYAGLEPRRSPKTGQWWSPENRPMRT
jgi:hypothetical protein